MVRRNNLVHPFRGRSVRIPAGTDAHFRAGILSDGYRVGGGVRVRVMNRGPLIDPGMTDIHQAPEHSSVQGLLISLLKITLQKGGQTVRAARSDTSMQQTGRLHCYTCISPPAANQGFGG